MYPTKCEVKCALLLAIFVVASAQSLNIDDSENETLVKFDEVFEEIDRNHQKLKQMLEDVVLKDRSGTEGESCICVPYYLCNSKTGEIIKDGGHLIEFKFNIPDAPINPCANPQDICCEPYKTKISSKANTQRSFECGYSGNISNEHQVRKPGQSQYAEFPWTVTISIKGGTYKCVGSLIHPQVVLTAAHCVNTSEIYKVRAGDWDLTSRAEPYLHQNEYVKTIIKHPEFNVVNLFNDVALLVLENPFVLDENVNTVCLAQAAPSLLNTIPDRCAGSGWGKIKGDYSTVMKKVCFSLVPHENCEEIFRTTRLGQWFELHQSFTCATARNGLDMCAGDGGGPLVCPLLGGKLRYQQVGLTAWGLECEQNLPSVFTKISQVRNWIDEQFDVLQYSRNYYTYKEG